MKEFFGFGGYTREPEGYMSWQHLLFVSSLMAIMITLAIIFGRKYRNEVDEKKNKVQVYKQEQYGAKEIRTKYDVLSEKDGLSLVEVELLTGRTHQIRAHFSSIGHPLLGDGKYGTNAMNKALGYKKQFLYSYRLKFAFTSDAGPLEYLNGKSFEVDDVWFKREFLNGNLTSKSN